jgi:hypothetical protein
MMENCAIFAFSSELMLFSHTPMYRNEMSKGDHDAKLILERDTTKRIKELSGSSSPIASRYTGIRDAELIECAYGMCSKMIGLHWSAKIQGISSMMKCWGTPASPGTLLAGTGSW